MKNKTNLILVCLMLSAFAVGCSYIQSDNSNASNKSLIDRAADTVFGNEKTGIPECDAIITKLETQTDNANETTFDSAKRIAIKQAIYAMLREKTGSANMSAADKTAYGKRCQQILTQMTEASPTPNKTNTNKK